MKRKKQLLDEIAARRARLRDEVARRFLWLAKVNVAARQDKLVEDECRKLWGKYAAESWGKYPESASRRSKVHRQRAA